MSLVFDYTDPDDDVLRVSEWQMPGVLSFEVIPEAESTFVNVDRDAVLSLIQALTEWAYPVHTPEGPNRSLIEELIVKAVKDQVSAVLPLHLSPMARQHPEPCAYSVCVRGRHPHTYDNAACWPKASEHRPQECPGAGQCPEADPEPGDVGYPRPPLPVREKTVPVCVCVLCKRPWSDSHGTVGEPCPGLQATDNVEDWHEALWRVRPSAPASDARYCGECGHLWEWHDPECGATRGKGRCECTRRPE